MLEHRLNSINESTTALEASLDYSYPKDHDCQQLKCLYNYHLHYLNKSISNDGLIILS